MIAPPLRDRFDLPLATSSTAARDAYAAGLDLLLAARDGAEARLTEAIAGDERFALAWIARARLQQVRGRVAEARADAARARALVSRASARERGHVEAIALAIDGDARQALDRVGGHVAEFPRDVLVLSLVAGVFSLIGFSGSPRRNEEARHLLDGLARHHGDDWWFLSAHGFACTEAGDPRRARPLIERSLALNPANCHAAHAFAHVLYEEGSPRDGADFLEGWLSGCERTAQLHGHLSWHLALFALADDRPERAWAVYETAIHPTASAAAPLNQVTDSVSWLWRAELAGEARRHQAWREAAECASRSYPRAGLAYADVHCAMAHAVTGDGAAVEQRLRELRDAEARGALPAGPMVPELIEGLCAWTKGDAEETVRRLEPIADEVVRLGGSHAQREMFEDTLLAAYLATGRTRPAEALLRRRLASRPSARDLRWLARAAGTPTAS